MGFGVANQNLTIFTEVKEESFSKWHLVSLELLSHLLASGRHDSDPQTRLEELKQTPHLEATRLRCNTQGHCRPCLAIILTVTGLSHKLNWEGAIPQHVRASAKQTHQKHQKLKTHFRHLRSCKSVDKLLHHHCSLANCVGLIGCRSLLGSCFCLWWSLGSCFCLLRPHWQTNAGLNARKRKHQCHKGEREQTVCLQAFSSESAPTILSATNLSSRNQVIIFNLVDMIINAWLMNCVESVQCMPGGAC